MRNFTVAIPYTTQHDVELSITFPAKNEVCPSCNGTGKHMTASLRHECFTQEDFDNDPDFREAYFAGEYDVTCTQCNGHNVVRVVDESKLTKRGKSKYEFIQRQIERNARLDAEYEAESRMERMMGA